VIFLLLRLLAFFLHALTKRISSKSGHEYSSVVLFLGLCKEAISETRPWNGKASGEELKLRDVGEEKSKEEKF
jgi:hypothetical protein